MTLAFRTLLAVTLGVVTVAAAEKATQYQTGAQWLVAVLLGTAFFVALCTAGAAVAAATWALVLAAVYEWRLARRIPPPPSARHARPAPLPPRLPDVDPRTLTRDARLIEDYAAETQPGVLLDDIAARPARDGLTEPMPDVTRAAWSGAVTDPSSLPWTAPVAEPVGGGR